MSQFLSPAITCLCCAAALPLAAQHLTPPSRPDVARGEGPHHSGPVFELSSPELVDGTSIPDTLKCARDGGSGMSPPLHWTNVPENTEGFVIVMQHYPRGTYPGVNDPSHYWLAWGIPADAQGIATGNPDGLGFEGSDKDGKSIGYTPPCSPSGSGRHDYTISVYAVGEPLAALPQNDSIDITWPDIMAALKGHVLGAASIDFTN